jgi:hypothetical protein
MLCSHTGSKLEMYTEKEDAKMTMKNWLFDFYVVEEIISRIGEEHTEETFDVDSMFPMAMLPLRNMITNMNMYWKISEVDEAKQRNGIRLVLILVLHLCIFNKSHHVEEDMIEFWNTYHFIINTEQAFPNHPAVYCEVLSSMIHLMVGFQNDPVRMLCPILYINAVK